MRFPAWERGGSLRYETVFIDLDETLFDFAKAEEAALEGTFRDFGIDLSEELALEYERINKSLWQQLEQGSIRLSELKSERFRRLFAGTELKIAGTKIAKFAGTEIAKIAGTELKVELKVGIDPEVFGRAYVEWLSRGIYPIEGAEDICRYLAGKYSLVVITNGIREVQLPRIRNSIIAPYVLAIVVSEDAGSSKPDRGIFEYACKAIGKHDRAGMIMLGDSLSSDIQGGINFGIDTCWTNLKHIDNLSSARPTYEVGRLSELREIL